MKDSEKKVEEKKGNKKTKFLPKIVATFLAVVLVGSGSLYAAASIDSPIKDSLKDVEIVKSYKENLDKVFRVDEESSKPEKKKDDGSGDSENEKTDDKVAGNNDFVDSFAADLPADSIMSYSAIDLSENSTGGENFNEFLRNFTGYSFTDFKINGLGLLETVKSESCSDEEGQMKEVCEGFFNELSLFGENLSGQLSLSISQNSEFEPSDIYREAIEQIKSSVYQECEINDYDYYEIKDYLETTATPDSISEEPKIDEICISQMSFLVEFYEGFDLVLGAGVSNGEEVLKLIQSSVDKLNSADQENNDGEIESYGEITERDGYFVFSYFQNGFEAPKSVFFYTVVSDNLYVTFTEDMIVSIVDPSKESVSDWDNFEDTKDKTSDFTGVTFNNPDYANSEYLSKITELMPNMYSQMFVNMELDPEMEKYKEEYENLVEKYIELMTGMYDNISSSGYSGIEFSGTEARFMSQSITGSDLGVYESIFSDSGETNFSDLTTNDTIMFFEVAYPKRMLDMYLDIFAKMNPELSDFIEVATESDPDSRTTFRLFLGDFDDFRKIETGKEMEELIWDAIELGLSFEDGLGIDIKDLQILAESNVGMFLEKSESIEDTNSIFVISPGVKHDSEDLFEILQNLMGSDEEEFCVSSESTCFALKDDYVIIAEEMEILDEFLDGQDSEKPKKRDAIFRGFVDLETIVTEQDLGKIENQEIVPSLEKLSNIDFYISNNDDGMISEIILEIGS